MEIISVEIKTGLVSDIVKINTNLPNINANTTEWSNPVKGPNLVLWFYPPKGMARKYCVENFPGVTIIQES